MSQIAVSEATPQRLLFTDEQWCLEVQRYHAVDRDVFTPILSYIAGTESILRYLGECRAEPHVLAQAQKILAHQGSADTTFDLEETGWVAHTRITEQALPQSAPDSSRALQSVMHLLETMQDRLERLERRLEGRIAHNDVGPPSVRPLQDEASSPRASVTPEARVSLTPLQGAEQDGTEPISETG